MKLLPAGEFVTIVVTEKHLLEAFWQSETWRTCFRYEEPTGESFLMSRPTQEVSDWLDQLEPGYHISHRLDHVHIEFLSPAQAVAFKIRWG